MKKMPPSTVHSMTILKITDIHFFMLNPPKRKLPPSAHTSANAYAFIIPQSSRLCKAGADFGHRWQKRTGF